MEGGGDFTNSTIQISRGGVVLLNFQDGSRNVGNGLSKDILVSSILCKSIVDFLLQSLQVGLQGHLGNLCAQLLVEGVNLSINLINGIIVNQSLVDGLLQGFNGSLAHGNSFSFCIGN